MICISRAVGAGGEEIGRTVAERLGYRYIDDEVIEQAAEWADLDPALVADVERPKPAGTRLLGRLADRSSPTRLPSGDTGRALPSDDDLRLLITDVLRSSAAEGPAVIVAHAASFALVGEGILRVLVTASPETRAARVGAEQGLAERAAAKAVRESDAARADYLTRFYGVKHELPTHFDIVISTDVLTIAEAANAIVAAAA
jgi:cytidylate kinase